MSIIQMTQQRSMISVLKEHTAQETRRREGPVRSLRDWKLFPLIGIETDLRLEMGTCFDIQPE